VTWYRITLQSCVIRQRVKIWGHTECCIGNEIPRDVINDLFIILSITGIMTIILTSSVLNFITFLNKTSAGTYKLCKTSPHQTTQQSNIIKTKQNITAGRAVPQLPSGVGSICRGPEMCPSCWCCHWLLHLQNVYSWLNSECLGSRQQLTAVKIFSVLKCSSRRNQALMQLCYTRSAI